MANQSITGDNRSLHIIQINNVFLLVLLFVFTYITIDDASYISKWADVISAISIPLLVYQVFIFRKANVSVLDFRFIFTVFSYIFLYGEIWLISCNMRDALFWGIILKYSERLLYASGLFCVCYSQAVFIGLLHRPRPKSRLNAFLEGIEPGMMDLLLYKAGICLLIISVPFRLYIDLLNVVYTQSSSSYSSVITPVGPAKDIAVLTIPGIICIIASRYKSKRTNAWILGIAVLYLVFIMILTGDRRYYMTGILSLALSYIRLFHPNIKFSKFIKFAVLAIIALNLLTVIRNIRSGSLTTVGAFFGEYWRDLFSPRFITETLSEFGLTFMTVVFAVKLIPAAVPYQYGFSFWGAIPSLLPIGWLFKGYFSRVSIINTLTSVERYAVGSSLTAELYANFGWFGIPCAIIAGVILSKLFPPVIKGQNSSVSIMRHYSLLYILINTVRASFMEVFRQSVIVLFVPVITIYIIYRHNLSRVKMSSNNS